LPAELLAALLSARSRRTRALKGKRALLDGIDWGGLCDDANAHVVGIIVQQRLADLGLLARLPANVRKAWDADAAHAQLQHAIQTRDAVAISRELSSDGIRHAFVKGFAYRHWLYRPQSIRLGGDVDLLIDRSNSERVRRLMRTLGFTQASCRADYQRYRPATAFEIARVEAHHYELVQFVKDHLLVNAPPFVLSKPFVQRVPFAYERIGGDAVLHSCVDIHWALHFAFRDASPLATLATVKTAGGFPLPVLAPEWNLVFSAFKLYHEAFERPRFGFAHLVDLRAILTQEAEHLDWSLIERIVTAHSLDAATFYTLSAVERLAQTEFVPSRLRARWTEFSPSGRAAPGGPELGDFVPYMLGRRVPSDYIDGAGAADRT
jgi:hypothetical protein